MNDRGGKLLLMGEHDFCLLTDNQHSICVCTIFMGSKNAVSSRASVLEQPEGGKVIYALRQLTDLTQVQLAETLGAAYATIHCWENGLIQPSPLAFKQLRVLIDELSDSSSKALQGGSQQLLAQYFSQEE